MNKKGSGHCLASRRWRLVITITIIELTTFLALVTFRACCDVPYILLHTLPKNCPARGLPLCCQLWVWLNPEFLTKREWLKWFPISNYVIVVITYLKNCKICPWLMNTDRPISYGEWTIFQFAAWKTGEEWEHSGPKIWWAGAERWVGVKKLPGARVGGCRAGNEVGSKSHRNKSDWRAEILSLQLRSHALTVTYVYWFL